ncbi:glycosyltransferase [Silvanigrella paludirubra]|uniref:Glycosyltransferase n=1 Tax=Silvanigrella paludirubra TaxID=2499159 RepID=A0A6N6VV26_9BACT|nr:glycosyltransferase [Silvanigrella paludirubra]KAB8039074.1 glycosyltransferase [Silvanigrella paludirubra]
MKNNELKVALVVDWLTVYGGAERVVEQIIECYPNCDIYSLIDFLNDEQRFFVKGKKAKTSFIQKLPFAKKYYRIYLPLMPLAIESFNLHDYDLIISSSHAVARGVITYHHQLHITYLQAPGLRYAYHDKNIYSIGSKFKILKEFLLYKLRKWDFIASKRADYTIANSEYVSEWNEKIVGVKSKVIYPPVYLDNFIKYFNEEKRDTYVAVGRLEPIKRFDLIIEAFNSSNKKLIIIGSGSIEKELKKLANDNISFVGFRNQIEIAEILSKSKAFLQAGCEGFGISMLESQACGTPVIAFAQGGALEVVNHIGVTNKPTGILFEDQSKESILKAIELFESGLVNIQPIHCLENAKRFSKETFKKSFKDFINQKIMFRSFKNKIENKKRA